MSQTIGTFDEARRRLADATPSSLEVGVSAGSTKDARAPAGVEGATPHPVAEFITQVGAASILFAEAVRATSRRPFELKEITHQIQRIGISSLLIVIVTSVVIGMVMAMQFAFGLQKFGGMEYTPRVVGVSFAQELAPTFIGIIVAARVSSGITAELGAMAVTEQIDAISALGADPIKKLVMPRLVACVMVMPILSTMSLVAGFASAMLITDLQFGISGSSFLSSALQSVTLADYFSGAMKSPFFGAIVASTGCYFGMNTRGGTAGVGANTTRAVVVTAIAILVADFLLTQVGYVIWPVR